MSTNYTEVTPEAVKKYDYVSLPDIEELMPVAGLALNANPPEIVVDVHPEGEFRTLRLPLEDGHAVYRPESICFSEDGDSLKDQLFEAYIAGYYRADPSPTVDGLELYEIISEQFEDEFDTAE